MKILHSADWHILLHKKKVPYKWQTDRFKTFFRKLIALEQQCDVHIIAGDVFDKKPEPDEVCLFLSYINSVTIPTYIIPGNHEATKKGETFLQHFTQENAIKNSQGGGRRLNLVMNQVHETWISSGFGSAMEKWA